MALWTNEGLLDKTRIALGVNPAPVYKLCLFTNPLSIGLGTTLSDLTECALPGYLPIALAPSSWTISVSAGLAQAVYPAQVFSFADYAGGVSIYGYFVKNVNSGKVHWAETFATAFPVPADGGALSIALTWYDTNG